MSKDSGHHHSPTTFIQPRTVFFICLILAGALLIFDRPSSRPGGLTDARRGIEGFFAPVLDIASSPFRALRNLGESFSSYLNAVEDNKHLRKEIADLKEWQYKALATEEKLKAYEKLFSAGPETPGTRIAARSIAESRGPFVHAYLLNVGQEQGVRQGYAVLNTEGILGRVIRTGAHATRVLALTDISSRIPVMSVQSDIHAIMVGDHSKMPLIDYVDPNHTLSEGEIILTSGDGGFLPRGLPVGMVVKGKDQAWRVDLFSNRAAPDYVWIYPFTPFQLPRASQPDEEGKDKTEEQP